MSREGYRYSFHSEVDPQQVEDLLHLAFLSSAALHGDATARLEARYALDMDQRRCVIDAASAVGRDANRLFVGYLAEHFGATAFEVHRCEDATCRAAGEVS